MDYKGLFSRTLVRVDQEYGTVYQELWMERPQICRGADIWLFIASGELG